MMNYVTGRICERKTHESGRSFEGNEIERWRNGSFTQEANSRDASAGKGE